MNNDFELTSFHIKMQKAYTRREVLKSVAASPFIFFHRPHCPCGPELRLASPTAVASKVHLARG